MLFSEAIKEFVAWKNFTIGRPTARGYVFDLRQLCLYLRDMHIEEINWQHIQEMTDHMIRIGWDDNSFVRKFISYRKFFDYWHRKDSSIMSPDWIPVKHMEYRQPRVMTETAYKKLLKTLEKSTHKGNVDMKPQIIRNTLILNLLWDTGARIGEIAALNVSEMDLKEKFCVIKTEKNKRRRPLRQIMWTESTNKQLKRWIQVLDTIKREKGFVDQDALFVSLTARNMGKRFQPSGISQMVIQLCDKAKIERLNAHSFRHHMGHDIIKKGGSNSDVSNILGHSNLESSYIYTIMSGEEIRKRYQQFKGK